MSDVLLWTSAYSQAKAGRPARTYIQQLCEDTGYNFEDLPEAMTDRKKWRERVRDIHASGMTRWWWWYLLNNRPYGKKKTGKWFEDENIQLITIKGKNIYILKKKISKGQPCHTNWKKSKDTQLVGQKKKKHRSDS